MVTEISFINLDILLRYLFKGILLLMFLVSVCICLLKPPLFFTASSEEVHLTPESSPELTKKSWFGSLMTTEKDETFTILVKGKPLATVKADLIHAFLSVSKV